MWKEETEAMMFKEEIELKIGLLRSRSIRFEEAPETPVMVRRESKLARMEYEKKEMSHWDYEKLTPMVIVIILLVVQNIVRGTVRTPSIVGISLCSTPYWMVYALFFVVVLLITLSISKKEMKDCAHKKLMHYHFAEGDFKWGKSETLYLVIECFIGGVLAAIVGVGGGVIFSPLMLDLGLPAKVVSITSMYLVLYTSLSSCI